MIYIDYPYVSDYIKKTWRMLRVLIQKHTKRTLVNFTTCCNPIWKNLFY